MTIRYGSLCSGIEAASMADKPAAECPRYKAIGNSMAVPVMRFIGKRIQHEITDSTNP